MPRKKKTSIPTEAQSADRRIPKELTDQLITGPITQGEFESIYRALKKDTIERAMSAEMTEYLGTNTVSPSLAASPTNTTAPAARPCSPTMARSISRCLAIARAVTSR